MKKVLRALAACAFTLSNAAHAGLIGDEVQARWIVVPFFDQTRTFVVGAGTELVGTWGVGHNLDVGDNYIEATLPAVVGIGSGVNWRFSSLDFGGIGGFSVATTFQGWSDSWLSYTSNSIDITFADLVRFPPGEGYIRITLLPSHVSEPASIQLLLVALAIAMALRLRVGGSRKALKDLRFVARGD